MENQQNQADVLSQNVTPAHMRRWLWGGMAICVVLWLAIPLGFHVGFGFKDFPKSLNEIGDSFGSVSALFSALTMAGVIYSLLLQRADISQTLAELTGSRKAQENIEVLEKQNLDARMILAEKHEARNAAMKALFEAQSEALNKQIEILQAQTAAAATRQFQLKFDRRLDRWREVREKLGDGTRQG